LLSTGSAQDEGLVQGMGDFAFGSPDQLNAYPAIDPYDAAAFLGVPSPSRRLRRQSQPAWWATQGGGLSAGAARRPADRMREAFLVEKVPWLFHG
jgi:hypothetical protein